MVSVCISHGVVFPKTLSFANFFDLWGYVTIGYRRLPMNFEVTVGCRRLLWVKC